MTEMMIRGWVVLVFIIASGSLFAQDDWENDEGTIENAEIFIEKEKVINLPPVRRNFSKIPPDAKKGNVVHISYELTSFTPSVSNVSFRIRPLMLSQPKLEKTFSNSVKFGFGNYTTPVLDLSIGNKRNDEYSVGARLNHISSATGPVDEKNSAFSNTKIEVDGMSFLNKATVGGRLNYSREGFHFYGYDTTETHIPEDIKHGLNRFGALGFVKSNNPKASYFYGVKASVNYLTDDYSQNELEAGLNAYFEYKVSNQIDAGGRMDAILLNQTGILGNIVKRPFVRINPYFNYHKDGLNIAAGARFVHSSSTEANIKDRLFGHAQVQYSINNKVFPYIEIGGDVERVTLGGLYSKNQFLETGLPQLNIEKPFAMEGGVKGNIGEKMGFGLGYELAKYRNMNFFVNSGNPSRFWIATDSSTVLNRVFGELRFYPMDNSTLGIKVISDSYTLSNEIQPWHKPTMQVAVNASFNLYKKIVLGADLNYLQGIQAKDQVGNAIDLDSILDINFSAEYIASNKMSVFLNGLNLLNKEYQLFNRYPLKGVQLIAGLRYNF